MSGCAQSTSQRWAASTRAYNATFTVVGDLYENGTITDQELLEIRRARLPISLALDRVHDAIEAGDNQAAVSGLEHTARLLELVAAAIELAADSTPHTHTTPDPVVTQPGP